jgi:hypothetical protein
MGMNDDNTVSFFSSHSLSAKAGFLAVHARKLQALAKRSGGDKSVGSKSATGSASSKTLSSARRIIGTSLDRPSERESESGASTFLGADQRHWEPTTSYLSALENREPASPGVGGEPPTAPGPITRSCRPRQAGRGHCLVRASRKGDDTHGRGRKATGNDASHRHAC